MRLTRRQLIAGATSLGSLSACNAARAAKAAVIVFDAFPIFDPRSITALVRSRFPERGEALSALWSARLFSATWLVTSAEHYESFETLADATLRASVQSLGLVLSDQNRQELVASYGQLSAWPDVGQGLSRLRGAGYRLALVSNLGEATLFANTKRAGLSDAFDAVLSTDRVKRFKPSPVAYAMAMDAFQLSKSDIAFAAFADWDAVGATWFGYRTAWINRLGAPIEPFGEYPAITSRGFEGVLQLAGLA